MANTGINDKILSEIVGIQKRSINQIDTILKGDKPFAMEEVDPEVKIWTVNNLGYEDMAELVTEFGEDKVSQLIFETRQLEERRK